MGRLEWDEVLMEAVEVLVLYTRANTCQPEVYFELNKNKSVKIH
jgi:hypothetical protein